MLAVAATGYGQGWAVPAKTPETPVPCTGCPNVDNNSLTVGYKAPIATFTGRYLDSSNTSEWFKPFRTARAKYVLAMPALDRIYFKYGDGSVASYKLSTFFTRLEGGERLVYAAPDGQVYRAGNPEVWLRWDTWFNPEIGSGWQTNTVDGSLRMTFFDVDDQGFVYIASTLYGWGIVKDDFSTMGGSMRTSVQKYPSAKGDSAPSIIASVKGATRYYAILGRQDMWDVTDRKNPVKLSTTNVPGLNHFAKNANADRIAIVDSTGSLTINTGDGFATGTAPLFTSTGFADVTSDGTNFFGLKYPSGIVVLVPSGNSYTEQAGTLTDPKFSANTIKYGDGYLVLTGADTGAGWDVRVYKVGANLIPTAVITNGTPADNAYPSYFRNYYGLPPNNHYVVPGYINMLDGTVVKSNGHTYLIICAKGLGDVYELSGGDSISVTNDGSAGTPNINSPTNGNGKTYYGDPIQFTAKSQSTTISTVAWNFGNPEAGTKNSTTSLINAPVPYQYGNLAKTGLGSKTVSASALNDSSVRGLTTATLESPVARFAIAATNPKFLFTQPNASSTAPVVLGDSFVDASDGRVESHFDSWVLDGVPTKTVPGELLPVGPCGQHSVTFTTFYGQYTGSGAQLTPQSGNFIVGLDAANGAVVYSVTPFKAAMDVAATDATSITFKSTSRVTNNTAIFAAAQLLGFSYTWELVTAAGASLGAPLTGTGTTAIPNFTVAKSAISAAQGARVRLTLSTTAPFNTGCTGFETSVALSNPLNAPDPKITQSGDCQTTPCTFTASSVNNIDTTADNWTFSWQVLQSNGAPADSTMVSAGSASTSVFSPTFYKTGTYTVKVTAQNAIGSNSAQTNVSITIATPVCAKMTSSSFVPTFSGSSGCDPYHPCQSGETLELRANNPLGVGYDANCSAHTYTWYLNGLQIATGLPATYTAQSSGTLTVSISNGTETKTYPWPGTTLQLNVGSTGGCTVNCGGTPPANPCGTLSDMNVQPTWSGASCPNGGGTCGANDPITFDVTPYLYDFNCSLHSFQWKFDGSTTANSKTAQHSFTSGSHTITLTVTRVSDQKTVTKNITINFSSGGSNNGGNGSCPTMTNTNVAISYAGPSSGCSSNTAAPCNNGEQIAFDAISYAGYDFSCSTHSFTWDFGDGGSATGKSPTHTYASSGQHTVKVSITNATQTTPFVRQITVSTGSTTPGTCGTITSLSLYIDYHNGSNTCNPYGGQCSAGESVNFTIAQFGTYDMNCATHSFDWDFGDGSPHANTKDAVHQYATAGTYTAKCVVNNGSQNVTLQQAVAVSGSSGGGADVQITPTITPMTGNGLPANTYVFTAAVSGAPSNARYTWNFGDGDSQNGLTVTHTYAKAGKYTVTLSVYSSTSQLLKTQTTTVGGAAKRRSVRH
ncbi:MAG TPA: PKD domain-containing protein [Thermoanaerobaculia bacterium]|nr:PKD domain-containing protein [Thermoanaerobaculia bacterium]